MRHHFAGRKGRGMKAIIISIGDEITSGHTVNTNAAWMAAALETCGVTPERTLALRDDIPAIAGELRRAAAKYSLVLVTGGLGPTHDDVTKPALTRAFHAPLARDPEVLRQVKAFFRKIGRPMPPVNEGQADVPEGFTALSNKTGTAPGLMLERKGMTLVAMPGVPSEMRHIMERHVLPMVRKKAGGAVLLRRVLRTAGIGESSLATLLGEQGFILPPDMAMAYLPHFGQVDLRITCQGTDRRKTRARLEKAGREIERIAGAHIFGGDDMTLEAAAGKLLAEKGLTLASAESCSGGRFAARITAVPGASAYYLAGAVAYSNESKMKLAGVSKETLVRHGAVSAETAAELAEGIAKAAGADIGISSTGVAGPSGGTKEKPVGLIYIGLHHSGKTETRKLTLGMDRGRNQEWTANGMLVWLWRVARDWPAGKR